eukprot:364786-Chlamydomonas_euryale.AAC.6
MRRQGSSRLSGEEAAVLPCHRGGDGMKGWRVGRLGWCREAAVPRPFFSRSRRNPKLAAVCKRQAATVCVEAWMRGAVRGRRVPGTGRRRVRQEARGDWEGRPPRAHPVRGGRPQMSPCPPTHGAPHPLLGSAVGVAAVRRDDGVGEPAPPDTCPTRCAGLGYWT